MAESTEPNPSDARVKDGATALTLLTYLFNARQRQMRAEADLDDAKENLKSAKREVESIMLQISGEVPRMHARQAESMPSLLEWRNEAMRQAEADALEAAAAEEARVAAANASEAEEDDDRDDDVDEVEIKAILTDGKMTFDDRFFAKKVGAIGGKTHEEWEITCQDCAKPIAHSRVPLEEIEPLREDEPAYGALLLTHFREGARIHVDLFHTAESLRPPS